MIKVVIPLALMLIIMLVRKIPVIGGKAWVALLVAGFAALFLGGIYNPIDWLVAWFDGIDRIAWIIGLSVFGAIYSETQTKIGAMETVVNVLRAKFGQSPRGLIVVVLIALSIAGSLLGDAIAAATVIGILMIGVMSQLGLSGELIAAIIAVGGCMGSIMPPITQAVFLSASLLGIDPSYATQPAYITVGIGIVFVCVVFSRVFIKKDMKFPDNLLMTKTAGEILKENWKSLIPLMVLIICVLCRTIESLNFISAIFNLIKIDGTPFLTWLSGVKILKMFSNTILLSILIATVVACCFKEMRGNVGTCVVSALKSIKGATITQACIALMLGAFYAAGTIEALQNFAQSLNSSALIWGGAVALLILSMLTGSQTSAQSAIFSFLGPTLVSMGYHPCNVAIFGSHVASAGQNMLPANLTVVVVAGLVSGQIGKTVNPLKSMQYCSICGVYLLVAGLLMIYLPAWPF